MTIEQKDANESTQERSHSRVTKSDGENLHHFLGTLKFYERFLLFLSKTDMSILQHCTRSTRMTLTSVGAMVLITGVLALFSAFFTIKNSFFRDENSVVAWGVSIVIATMYSIAIMAFDRELVSCTDKKATLWRIPFAVLIGIVIAFPIELQLQHGKISEKLDDMAKVRNADIDKEIKSLKASQDKLLTDSIGDLEKKIEGLTELRDQEQVSAKSEALPENGLCRDNCEEHKANAERYQAAIDETAKKKEDKIKEITKSEDYIELKNKIAEFELQQENNRKNSNDLLSQKLALSQLHKDPIYGTSAMVLSIFLFIFFVTFECFPVLIKYFMEYTEYHAYYDARMRINIAKITAISNHWWKKVEQKPELLITTKTEVTDLFQEALEDSERDLNNPDDPEDKPHV